jgi:hypothetical protein
LRLINEKILFIKKRKGTKLSKTKKNTEQYTKSIQRSEMSSLMLENSSFAFFVILVPETNNFRQKKVSFFFVHRFCHLNHMVPKNATWPSPFNFKPSSHKSKKRSGKTSNISATQRGTHLPERDPQIQTNNYCTEFGQTGKRRKKETNQKERALIYRGSYYPCKNR